MENPITQQSEQQQDLELQFIQQINTLEKLRLTGVPTESYATEIHRISVVGGELYVPWLQQQGFSLDDAEVFCSVFMPYVYFRLVTSYGETLVDLATLKKSTRNDFLRAVSGMFGQHPEDPVYLACTGELLDKSLEYFSYLANMLSQ